MKKKSKALTSLFLLILILIGSTYLFLPEYVQSLDSRVRDIYFNYRGAEPVSNQIVIVDIDEKSLQELGQWPWERDKLAQILLNLKNKGAKVIGLDIVFAEADKTSPKRVFEKFDINTTSFPDYDVILAKALYTTPTVLGYVFDFDEKNKNEISNSSGIFILKKKKDIDPLTQMLSMASQKSSQNSLDMKKNGRQHLLIAKGAHSNIRILQQNANSGGFFNNIPDSDGLVRSVPLIITYERNTYPSLALEMYKIAHNIDKVTAYYQEAGINTIELKHKGKIVNHFEVQKSGKMYLNLRGPKKSYQYISAVDIYNNSVDRKKIENKFVLIGTSASGLLDLRATSMDSAIPGVELHANAIDNLLNNDMLVKPSYIPVLDLVSIILLSFLIIVIYSRFSFGVLLFTYSLSFLLMLSIYYYILFELHVIMNLVFPIFTMIVSFIGVLGINYFFESKLKDSIKKSFSKKVSKQVMDDLLINPDRNDLSAKEVNVTIYFSDIRSFTTISETLKSPKLITEFLNFYMNEMVIPIEKSSGTIDKFIGDAVMAYWNAPVAVENHADKAVTTALEQVQKRDELNITIHKRFGFNVDYGIGINTGDAVVGEIGSYGRSDYTIIGDAVNLASRLEGLCKPYKVRLIISEFTRQHLKKVYTMQLLDIVRVKGKKEPVKIYEVLNTGYPDKMKLEELQEYEKAHSLYVEGDFSKAKEIFETLFSQYSKYLYDMYAKRCYHLLEENVQDFDGVFEFHTK